MLNQLLLILSLFSVIYAKKPLGTVSNPIPLAACPPSMGFPAGTLCTNITVSCPDTTDLDAVYGVLQPSDGVFRGTVTLMSGAGGTTIFDHGYINIYHTNGLRVVPIIWYPPGWNPSDTTGATRQNLKAAACRCATVYKYLFETVHYGDTSRGFCTHGHSGGGASIGYTMADYGGDDWIDYGLM